jgi:ferredoxin
MFKVTVNGVCYTAERGELLSAVLTKNGIWVEHPCGGKGLCEKCRVKVNGRDELCCAYKINSDITVEIPEQEKTEALEYSENTSRPNENLCLCLDIGTTTLELALVDKKKKEILKKVKAVNPQIAMGADVISRIAYATEYGVVALQNCVVNKINELISQMGIEAVEKMYNKYGSFAVFFSAFTPIPYKVFTIASGILSMNFWKFMLASFFGRGLRFFIVSIVLMLFGEAIKQYIELVIIAVTIVIILFFVILYKKRKSLIK